MNELFHTLQGMRGGRVSEPPAPKPLDLDWRGKSVRLLTPDETARFAQWAYREIERLREERDGYLGRAIDAEIALGAARAENDCGNDPAPAYDTTHERDMDMGTRTERLTRDYGA